MAITTRAGKGSELTWAELDANFNELKNGTHLATTNTTYGVGSLSFVASIPANSAFGTLQTGPNGRAGTWSKIWESNLSWAGFSVWVRTA